MTKVVACKNCDTPIEVTHFGTLEWCNENCREEWISKNPHWKKIFKIEILLKMLQLERGSALSISDILTATQKGLLGQQGFFWTSVRDGTIEGRVRLIDNATDLTVFESDPDTMTTLIECLKNANVQVQENNGDELK